MEVLKKIVSILDILSQENDLGAADLAGRLKLPTTTVHRILKELTSHGMLDQNQYTKKYRLGWKMMKYGYASLQDEQEQYNISLIRPYLKMLSDETKETVFLTVMKQGKVVCIAKVDGSRNLRFYAQIGKEMPINGSAPAKVLVAFQPEQVQADIVKKTEFIKHTPDSISDKNEYFTQLEKVKSDGYGICDNELEIGCKAVAVPVFDSEERVFASIALIGPSERITSDFDSIMDSMKRISDMINKKLKWG